MTIGYGCTAVNTPCTAWHKLNGQRRHAARPLKTRLSVLSRATDSHTSQIDSTETVWPVQELDSPNEHTASPNASHLSTAAVTFKGSPSAATMLRGRRPSFHKSKRHRRCAHARVPRCGREKTEHCAPPLAPPCSRATARRPHPPPAPPRCPPQQGLFPLSALPLHPNAHARPCQRQS
jgi:hypothetical protein